MGRRRRTPGRRRTASRRRTAEQAYRALGFATVLLVAAVIAALGYLVLVFPEEPGRGDGREISLELDEGMSIEGVAEALGRADVLSRPWLFTVYMRLLGADERLRVGSVRVRDDMSPRELARRVATGLGPIRARVMIPEGNHRFDIARRLASQGIVDELEFIRATEDRALLAGLSIEAPTAEGYLFPDTYEISDEMTPAEIVTQMVRNFHRRLDRVLEEGEPALSALGEELGYSLHEVVILASVVEKEAAVNEERPVIAGVFLNRLRSATFLPRHRLQADPTVSYGCLVESAPSCAAFRGRISRAMLEDPLNRYNTYRHGGLPPGPIANPGLASLAAVLEPSQHDYLYFVARGNGRHAFSATLADHNRFVDRYIRGR